MSRPRFRVLITDFIQEPLEIERAILGDIAEVIAANAQSSEELETINENPDALMVYHFVSIRKPLLTRLTNCKLIVRCGAGFDNVDCLLARERGIDVANVPDYGTEDVADTALALALSLARGTHRLNQLCQQGTQTWTYELAVPLHRIRGQTFGIIGLGRIGIATALRAKAFGFKVMFYDPYVVEGIDKAIGVTRVESLQDLMRQSNFVSCHCMLTPETHHMINGQTIEWLPEGSYLINTARGAVVEPEAVLRGLSTGRLAGAALDVLEQEPPSADHPLVSAWRIREHVANQRLILTPHAAFYSVEGLEDMRRKGAENVRRCLLGEKPRNIVN
ncbi:MAG: C-terminal binding protein [Planctomycetales bacterium]|nr:C-terminal binding protein [Planctomycetales bacterium]